MRTASGRARGLLAFVLLALSAAWVLLRRRSGAPAALAAVPGAPPDRRSRPAPERALASPVAAVADGQPGQVPGYVLATDAGFTAEPDTAPAAPASTPDGALGQVPDDVLATDAGLTAEPSTSEPLTVEPAAAPAVTGEAPAAAERAPGEMPDDVLATDAGLTAEPPTGELPSAAPPTATPPTPTPPAAEPEGFSDAPTAEIPVPALAVPLGADDLRAIRGIGPSTERILHGLDITTYGQIAELDDAGLERVRDALSEFRGRLEREDWIGQARELHRQKYGEAP